MLWVSCLFEESSVVKANPTGAGFPMPRLPEGGQDYRLLKLSKARR